MLNTWNWPDDEESEFISSVVFGGLSLVAEENKCLESIYAMKLIAWLICLIYYLLRIFVN
jgi:hypothetical protein